MKIIITAESTVDLTEEIKNKYNIKTLPFTILLGEQTYQDGEIDTTTIFDFVKKTKQLPKTSAVNEYQYDEFFTNLLKENDAIIHFTLSSEMSSAYNNAVASASKLKNVFVIDSRSLSTGIALLAIRACKMAEEGFTPEQIVSACEKLTEKVQTSFVINSLDFLYKGGRCNALQRFGANLLKLKPCIVVKDGKMGVHKNYRGKWTECLKLYYNDLMQTYKNIDKDQVFITYTTATPEIIDYLKECLTLDGFKNIYITTAGGTITSHCGENTLGVLFISND